MSGKLVFVSGLTGSGKTTLVGEALKQVENLEVLLTYTTRPIRAGEENSYEYLFVSDAEYEALQARSNNWDETIYGEYRYASDADEYIDKLKRRVNIIVSVTPNIDDIAAMSGIYRTKPVTIWIDTDYDTARNRITRDLKRSSRAEDESIKSKFDIIYRPSGLLPEDRKTFTELIKNVIGQK